jgi:antitoxin (DNA-binding transcriptional repressor) of toxin-antitoxin stability system
MRELDRGESFVVTRNGIPVGELRPLANRQFVSADRVVAMLRGAPRIDSKRFVADIDKFVDQDPTPRG